MNKPITLIFYGADDNAGRAMAEKLRSEGAMSVFLRDAGSFHGATDDPAEKVIIMRDVSQAKQALIRETYQKTVEILPVLTFFSSSEPVPLKRGPGRPRKAVA